MRPGPAVTGREAPPRLRVPLSTFDKKNGRPPSILPPSPFRAGQPYTTLAAVTATRPGAASVALPRGESAARAGRGGRRLVPAAISRLSPEATRAAPVRGSECGAWPWINPVKE